jgi:hypothetical protein
MATNTETLIDTTKVVLANITAITFGFIELDRMRDDVEWWLKITSMLIAISYTVWKWRKDYKKSKK